mmetsp:Transcript_17401/g.31734  ORF Transcript_17401/g.31734 Transcript_17401/m.31734 type:complete len:101 (+) Transcript_17401:138-440(+)
MSTVACGSFFLGRQMNAKLSELRALLVAQGGEQHPLLQGLEYDPFPLTKDNFGAFAKEVGVEDVTPLVVRTIVLLLDTAKCGEVGRQDFLLWWNGRNWIS